jgi:ribonucleotide reductase alpha subunit
MEPLDLEKMHKVTSWACEGLTGVSASEVEIKSGVQFYDGIPTKDVQELLIKSAADLITEDTPNYQFVAGRLVAYDLRKRVFGKFEPDTLHDHVGRVVAAGHYDPELLARYTREEFDQVDRFMDHSRDEQLSYAGIEQFRQKYLIRDRTTGEIMETPQVALALISMTGHMYDGSGRERMRRVREFYEALSTNLISLPTPIMAGVRGTLRQFSSCVVIDAGDSLDSITTAATSIVKYVSKRAGIGLNIGRLRGEGMRVRSGDTVHTGLTPFVKLWQAAVHSCSAGAVRTGAATFYFPAWHLEFEKLIVLKNGKGTEETRARHVDYCVQLNGFLYRRLLEDGDVSLFSPASVPGLYEAFFADQDEFARLYVEAEADQTVPRRTIRAREMFTTILRERKETGRIYVMNVDNVNRQSAFDPSLYPVYMSNLCVGGDTEVYVRYESGETETVQIKDVPAMLFEHRLEVLSGAIEQAEEAMKMDVHGIACAPGWEWRQLLQASKTASLAEVVRVTCSSYSIVCTPDHRVFTKNRGYVAAKDLLPTDRLWRMDGEHWNDPEITVEYLEERQDVYDLTVAGNHNFFADGVLVHNCTEINLPTIPVTADGNGMISLCTLAAVNWGVAKDYFDFELAGRLLVRFLDNLLDYQEYPMGQAEVATRTFRPLGVGIINLAYWMAKNGMTYSRPDLDLVNRWAEWWSYSLIKASAELARERGTPDGFHATKYAQGVLPVHLASRAARELLSNPGGSTNVDWTALAAMVEESGLRNCTLMALMPSETSALVSNSTNGIEPPLALVSVKKSKHGVLPQVVPEIRRLKNKYETRWAMPSTRGYLDVMAVLQCYVDQSISVNTTYNPRNFEGGEIPLTVLIEDLVDFYRKGGKCLYYSQVPGVDDDIQEPPQVVQLSQTFDDDCDACKL